MINVDKLLTSGVKHVLYLPQGGLQSTLRLGLEGKTKKLLNLSGEADFQKGDKLWVGIIGIILVGYNLYLVY